MQLFALNEAGQTLFAKSAQKKRNYFCMECGSIIRLREGFYRQPHFYHLQKHAKCRQNGKSLTHLNLQLYIQNCVAEDQAKLEVIFPHIRRIADVVWEKEKIVFEIQCSPILCQEVLMRVKDYAAEGYQVVWILHDQRFNRFRLSAAEAGLKFIPHYYTNMTATGKGQIYDQKEWIEQGLRKKVLPPLEVDISKVYRKPQCTPSLGFVGDFASLEAHHPHVIKAYEYEKNLKKTKISLTARAAGLRMLGSRLWTHLLKKFCKR